MESEREVTFRTAFGERVRRLRIEKGLSQYQLADISNLDRSTIKRVESGTINTTLETAKVIAEALGMTLSELVDLG